MSAPAPLKSTPLNAIHRGTGGENGGFRRLGHARPVFRHSRGAPGGAEGGRAVRRQPHGRDRNSRSGGGRAGRLPHHQCRRQAASTARRTTRACSTNMAASWTTSWCTRSPTITSFCASTRRIRRRISSTSRSLNRFDADVEFASDRYAQLAIQGPSALATLQKLTAVNLRRNPLLLVSGRRSLGRAGAHRTHRLHGRRRFRNLRCAGRGAADLERNLWKRAANSGSSRAGWARATRLRLEAKMALYGHEIHASITPARSGSGLDREAGQRATSWAAPRCCGRRKAAFAASWWVLKCAAAASARDGYEVFVDGAPAGWVTSGSPSPTLNKNIGLVLPARSSRRSPDARSR